jgi:hypothetical protein
LKPLSLTAANGEALVAKTAVKRREDSLPTLLKNFGLFFA